MKIYGQDTGKGRNHDYDPAEERRQAKKSGKTDNRKSEKSVIAVKPCGAQCPACGRIVAEK